MNKVFVFGSINMDLVFTVKRLPESGETLRGDGFVMTPGGKGANQAVACARQGIETYMIGSIGTDQLSLACKEALVESGVDCRFISETKASNCGVAGIFVEPGNNRIVTHAGANAVHDTEKIAAILNEYGSEGDWLISQLEVPVEVIAPIFQIAKSKKMKTILNAAPARVVPEQLLHSVDILAVNESETATLTGIMPVDSSTTEIALSVLINQGVQAVLLTLGENGSLYHDATHTWKQPAYRVQVVDTTTAGDTYIGVFLASLVKREPVTIAMQTASAAAALAVRTLGAQRSIPKAKQIKDFMSSIKEGE